ncbi:Hypothetical predicted protein [Mytilus galloprovincialis]|uniref:Integrase zinc-binding domain-containing protein n=1 Tax=Mytilus galloprovincialis TaxID=29158 RepID=A0A8B6F7Q2_MYTGA|nr:Hypothetical predicted protein [Mytilus galloprovincialis]
MLCLEQANEHAGKDYILTARTLVRSGEKVPVRLMNTELDPKTIYPGSTIAQMTGVEQVLDSNISSNEQKHDGLRPDLQDLLDRTSDELTSKDKQKVESLLIENQNFNDKDDDSKHHDLSLIEIQKNDHDLKIVTKWVETDERPDYKDISDKGFFLRSLWNQWNNLELRDGLIYRRFEDPATKIVKMQAIIPLSERKKVLQFSHDDKCSAHLGIHKTFGKNLDNLIIGLDYKMTSGLT